MVLLNTVRRMIRTDCFRSLVFAGVAAMTMALGAATLPGAEGAPASEAAKKAVHPQPQEMEALAAKDPLLCLKTALQWSDDNVAEYTCQLEKQEKIGGELHKTETMRMKFRAGTFSVYLKWIAEPSKGQEVIYIDGANSNKAVVHPSGILGVLFRKVLIDPTSKMALKYSRRPVTMVGMANMLRITIPQCEAAKANGDLTLTYEGLRYLNGRPTYVFKRTLPKKGDYQAAVLDIYVDKEYMVCVRTDAFDWEGGLLSQYIYTDFAINPGLTDKDFDPSNGDYGYRVF